VRWAVLVVSLGAAALFFFLPRRLALVLPALVAAYYVATGFVVDNGRHGIHVASVGSLWAGIRVTHPDWVDRAVGRDASVTFLWTGKLADPHALWENEFFSRSVRQVDALGVPAVDPLATRQVARSPDGRLVDADGNVVHAQYVLTDGATEVAGRLLRAQDPRIGLRLYRVNGPIVVLSHVAGLYPNDTWSGRTVTYERVHCPGGRLTVTLGSDPSLFSTSQRVTARVAGRVVGAVSVPPTAQRLLTIPLAPSGGTCRAVFTVARTKVPGHGDPRPLGAHFLSFAFRP
jgi:hypothetical protein